MCRLSSGNFLIKYIRKTYLTGTGLHFFLGISNVRRSLVKEKLKDKCL